MVGDNFIRFFSIFFNFLCHISAINLLSYLFMSTPVILQNYWVTCLFYELSICHPWSNVQMSRVRVFGACVPASGGASGLGSRGSGRRAASCRGPRRSRGPAGSTRGRADLGPIYVARTLCKGPRVNNNILGQLTHGHLIPN